MGIVKAVLDVIGGTKEDITHAKLLELTVADLKEILRVSGGFVTGTKGELANRIFAEIEATEWKKTQFLKYPVWLPELIVPMSFKSRAALLNSISDATCVYKTLTTEKALTLPQFTEEQLTLILMTPSTSKKFPYSKSLVRCELFQQEGLTHQLKFKCYQNKFVVWNEVKPSFKKQKTHSVFLCYHLPSGAEKDEALLLLYFMSNKLCRFCTCKNGTSSNCSHIALTFRQIAILQGIIVHREKAYVSAISQSVNMADYN